MDIGNRASATVGGRAVFAVSTEREYAEAAVEVGRNGPLPVLTAAWEDFLASSATMPVSGDAVPQNWRGSVVVCDVRLLPVGQVLAGATGRALVVIDDFREAVQLSREGPVTVVAGVSGASAITPAQLAGISHDAQLGLFVARELAAASALAARTVLHGPAVGTLDDLSFDPLGLTGPTDNVIIRPSPTQLRERIGSGVRVLAGYGHARDCLMHLEGGGICGRRTQQAQRSFLPLARDRFAGHPTACQQGAGCWRDDVTIDDHVRAAELRAAIVLLDGCRTAVAGGGSIGPEVSLPLTMLEGSAIATVCAAGTRGGLPQAGQLFQGLVGNGLALGEALREVNSAIDAGEGSLGKLVLFGDGGLVVCPTNRPPAAMSLPLDDEGQVTVRGADLVLVTHSKPLLPVERGGPLVVPRADRRSSWVLAGAAGHRGGAVGTVPCELADAWVERVRPFLQRLRALGSAGFSVDLTTVDVAYDRAASAVRARAVADHRAAAVDAMASFNAALGELSDVQRRMVTHEIESVASSFYQFWEVWPAPVRVRTSHEPVSCPQCGIDAAIVHRIRPTLDIGPKQMYMACVRCGEVISGAESFVLDVELRIPSEICRGEPFMIDVTVTNTGDLPADVAIGASIWNERRFHCKLADSKSFEVQPHNSRTVSFPAISDAERTIPDLQAVKVLVAADGAVRYLTRSVWLRI